MDSKLSLLVPTPQQIEEKGDAFSLPQAPAIYLARPAWELYTSGQYLGDALEALGLTPELTATLAGDPAIVLRLDHALLPRPQHYRLQIDRFGVTITGGDASGLFYGVCTLVQLVRIYQAPGKIALPHLQLVDWPDFPHRGVMLDVSRDKVPTMETLYDLVDLLASLKINQLQLYTEHTFAYRGHEVVWQEASAMTGAEILALDAYCREHCIELVPNQNSFGHMHRWLKHEPYRHLAEVPEGQPHPLHDEPEPYSLCPGDPGSLALLEDLYAQLLPHFSSGQINVGLDETFDLGRGRSQAACAERGAERVYLEFLCQIHQLIRRHGRTMQFWGDIILKRPELIAELPKDTIALEWGYEADHPFAEHGQQFAEAGLSFYVCPGTSSWNSLAGRTDNTLGNLRNAAVNGKKHGAIGYLNTDWGDFGHAQPLPVSYLGYLAGAAFSWNASTAEDETTFDAARLLSLHVFQDDVEVMGRLAYELGNAYAQTGVTPHNSSVLFLQFIWPIIDAKARQAGSDEQFVQEANRLGRLATEARFDSIVAYVDKIMVTLDDARSERTGAGWLQQEFRWVADALRFAARLGAARVQNGVDKPVADLPAEQRAALAADLRSLIKQHREVWLLRNRPGGLEDSLRWPRRLLEMLEA